MYVVTLVHKNVYPTFGDLAMENVCMCVCIEYLCNVYVRSSHIYVRTCLTYL